MIYSPSSLVHVAASISLLSSCYFEYEHTSSDDRKALMKRKSETSSDWWSVRSFLMSCMFLASYSLFDVMFQEAEINLF